MMLEIQIDHKVIEGLSLLKEAVLEKGGDPEKVTLVLPVREFQDLLGHTADIMGTHRVLGVDIRCGVGWISAIGKKWGFCDD